MCPYGIMNAKACYGNALTGSKNAKYQYKVDKLGATAPSQKMWCQRADIAACGCVWKKERNPYGPYKQTGKTPKAQRGYCCYTACTNQGNQGNQCCNELAPGGGPAEPRPKSTEKPTAEPSAAVGAAREYEL